MLTAPSARARPALLETTLDFEADFRADDTDDCDPLLARHDRLVELEAQRQAYADMDLRIIDRGHFTGMAATNTLRAHVRRTIDAAARHRTGRGTGEP